MKYSRLGIWDLYQEIAPELANIPGSSRLEQVLQLRHSMPYVWKMLRDIGSIRSCWVLLFFYVLFDFAAALIPAASLW